MYNIINLTKELTKISIYKLFLISIIYIALKAKYESVHNKHINGRYSHNGYFLSYEEFDDLSQSNEIHTKKLADMAFYVKIEINFL